MTSNWEEGAVQQNRLGRYRGGGRSLLWSEPLAMVRVKGDPFHE